MSDQKFSYVALQRIRPNAQWQCSDNDYENLVWLDESQEKPTFNELWQATEEYVAELQSQEVATQYQRDRASAYPSIQEQLDMQYWDAINGTTTWQDAINAVKAQFPKP